MSQLSRSRCNTIPTVRAIEPLLVLHEELELPASDRHRALAGYAVTLGKGDRHNHDDGDLH